MHALVLIVHVCYTEQVSARNAKLLAAKISKDQASVDAASIRLAAQHESALASIIDLEKTLGGSGSNFLSGNAQIQSRQAADAAQYISNLISTNKASQAAMMLAGQRLQVSLFENYGPCP